MIKVIDHIRYKPEGAADKYGLNKTHNAIVRQQAEAYKKKLRRFDTEGQAVTITLTGTVGGQPAAPQVEVLCEDPALVKKIQSALSR